jgi:hypothetical protein
MASGLKPDHSGLTLCESGADRSTIWARSFVRGSVISLNAVRAPVSKNAFGAFMLRTNWSQLFYPTIFLRFRIIGGRGMLTAYAIRSD